MIPLKLELKNFLSYGPKLQTIDFGSYPLICLSGKNGHGKSALLDAMTWSLWGQARKTSGTTKPDAQLLRLGQTNMMVIFDFFFNGQTYRIRREFALTRSKNPYACLEFGVLDQNKNTVRPLTEKTIRSTQKKIESLLGLDFDSFVNSAFLRQGQANEFSKKSPKDRKEILASILQLDTYERIRKAAQEKAKQGQTEIHHLGQLQERIAHELAKKTTLQEKKLQLTKELEQTEKQEVNNKKTAQDLEHKKNKLAQQKQDLSVLLYQHKQVCDEKNNQEQEVVAFFKLWRSTHKKQRTLPDLQVLEQQREQLTKELNAFQHIQQHALELKENYLKEKEREQQLISQIRENHLAATKKKEVMIERLQAEQSHGQISSAENEKRKANHEKEREELKRQQQETIKRLKHQATVSNELKNSEQQFEKRKMYYHQWVARANTVNEELKNLDQKKRFTHDTTNPSCPLCEQNLSASRKRFLQTKFTKLSTSLIHKQTRLTRILTALKATLVEQHSKQEELKKEHDVFTAQETKLKELKKSEHALLQTIDQLNQELTSQNKVLASTKESITKETTDLQNMINNFEKELLNNQEYQIVKKTREKLQKKLTEITYDPKAHKELLKRAQVLEKKLQEIRAFSQELAKQLQRKEEIQQLCARLRTIKKQKKSLEKKLEIFKKFEEEQKQLSDQKDEFNNQVKNLQQKKEQLLQEKGMLEQEQATLEKLKQEQKYQAARVTKLTETIDDYQTLATALGKDGIQALLIEDALPEIEQEANDLLAQLTNNQAHIIIESLRDLKKGGTKETLDIKISDPMGIRPYELFSGGEAFRIDFALRIAISKLLARRAGTSLQTLIIDEGFGSQDEEGLNLVMDAIHTIQNNFEKVIIVSHLPTMRDQFPVHFMIDKGPQGSVVTFIEH